MELHDSWFASFVVLPKLGLQAPWAFGNLGLQASCGFTKLGSQASWRFRSLVCKLREASEAWFASFVKLPKLGLQAL
jgi:hypothetical protein